MSWEGGANKEAGGVDAGSDAHFAQDPFDALIPVLGAAAKSVTSFAQSPEGARLGDGTISRRADQDNFVIWEGWMAKGVFAIALFGSAAVPHG